MICKKDEKGIMKTLGHMTYKEVAFVSETAAILIRAISNNSE